MFSHSTHQSSPSSLHQTIKPIQMLHLRQWMCNIQTLFLHDYFKTSSLQTDKSISINTSLVNLCFCYKPKVFARYSIHSINRKICNFVFALCEVQLSAPRVWCNTHTLQVLAVNYSKELEALVLLLLRCSYGVFDEYCGVSLLDCAGYKAKRKAPFELQLIGQRGYPCSGLVKQFIVPEHWRSSSKPGQIL